jgi:hypothetical protein
MNVQTYLVLPMVGSCIGVLFSICIAQCMSLVHVARNLEVDLLQLRQYSNIANPLIRLVVLLLAAFSLFLPPIVLADDPRFTTAATAAATLGLLAVLPILLLYGYPILILQRRVRDEKHSELNSILQLLTGDDEAIKSIVIQGRGVPMTTADLLTHQMFVESRWEWPIASHIQKLILFGLLPPVVWALATTVEHVIY